MGSQCLKVGLCTRLVLSRRTVQSCGQLQILPPRRQQFFTGRFFGKQLLIPARLGGSVSVACRRILGHCGSAPDHGLLGTQSVVVVDRIHLAQQLADLDRVAHFGTQSKQSPWRRRTDAVDLPRLDIAHSKNGWAQRFLFYFDHCDSHWGQRPRAQGHVAQQANQGGQHRRDGKGASTDGNAVHHVFPLVMPRR